MGEWLLDRPRLLAFLWVFTGLGFLLTAGYGIATATPKEREIIITIVYAVFEAAVSE